MSWSNVVLGYFPETITPVLHYSNTPEKSEQNSQFTGRKNLNFWLRVTSKGIYIKGILPGRIFFGLPAKPDPRAGCQGAERFPEGGARGSAGTNFPRVPILMRKAATKGAGRAQEKSLFPVGGAYFTHRVWCAPGWGPGPGGVCGRPGTAGGDPGPAAGPCGSAGSR
jgi:hypothetical protein